MSPGDIVTIPGGELYRVLWSNEGVTHVEHVDGGWKTTLLADDLTVVERHPGGQGAAK